jgi:hypothetical protein
MSGAGEVLNVGSAATDQASLETQVERDDFPLLPPILGSHCRFGRNRLGALWTLQICSFQSI